MGAATGDLIGLLGGLVSRTLLEQLVAVFLGALLALLSDRYLANRRQKQSRNALRDSLNDALAKNASLVGQLRSDLRATDTFIPTYPMDRELLDATASEKYSIGLSPDVCRAIDHARYEIRHLDEKLRVLRDAGSQLDLPLPSRRFYLGVRQSCIQHLHIVEEAIAQAEAALKRSRR